MLHPSAEMLTRYHASLGSSLVPNATATRELEILDQYRLSKLAQAADEKTVVTVVLSAARILCKQRDGVAVIVGRGGGRKLGIRFEDREQMETWSKLFVDAVKCPEKNLSDFTVERQIGKGASGRVYLVQDQGTNESLALKVIEKSTVYESDDAYRHAMDERLVLQMARSHPFVLNLSYAFQNAKRLFLVTEYCAGGDLFDYMEKRIQPMDEHTARFIAAEILLALEHLHSFGIVYRDLKLENILLDNEGHIRIADFGLSKLLKGTDGNMKLTNTFCGTREYVAPEMIRGVLYDTTLDIWTFGILLYEMLSGRTPFYSQNHNEIYKRIEKAPIFYPHHLSEECRNLLEKLLKRDPAQRIGAGEEGLTAIKKHRWFKGVDWDALYKKSGMKSPLKKHCRAVKNVDQKASAHGRNKVMREKAMTTLLADLKEDHEYVQGTANQSAVDLSRRPQSPMAKRSRTILAGYAFCEKSSKALSDGGKEPQEVCELETVSGADDS